MCTTSIGKWVIVCLSFRTRMTSFGDVEPENLPAD